MESRNQLSNFIKYQRNKQRLTQEQLAEKSGVGLRFIRDLEQGKESLRLDKVNQVLALFGYQNTPGSQRIKDPYEILRYHFNRNVHLNLKDRQELVGFLVDPIQDATGIKGWKFVSNDNGIEYQKTKNPSLEVIIPHEDIENIVNI